MTDTIQRRRPEARPIAGQGLLIVHGRKRKGMSQADVATMLDTTRQYMSDVEAGMKAIGNRDRIQILADELDLDVDELYAANHRIAPEVAAFLARNPKVTRKIRALMPTEEPS